MARQNNASKKDSMDFGFTVLAGGMNSLIGKTISINLKERNFFGVGPIWLTPKRYWATVPPGLSEEEYSIIKSGLNSGEVIEGKQFIPPVDKPEGVLDEYWSLVKANGICEPLKEKLRRTLNVHDGVDRGYTAMEIILECARREKKWRHRPNVIQWLEEALNNCEGPLTLYEPPDEEEGLKIVTITPDGEVVGKDAKGNVVDQTNLASPQPPPPPQSHKRGTKSKKEALGELLE